MKFGLASFAQVEREISCVCGGANYELTRESLREISQPYTAAGNDCPVIRSGVLSTDDSTVHSWTSY